MEFLAAWSADHKNSISSFALLSIHAPLDKVADAKEKKKKPNGGFGGTQWKDTNRRRSPRLTGCSGVEVPLRGWRTVGCGQPPTDAEVRLNTKRIHSLGRGGHPPGLAPVGRSSPVLEVPE